jgi:hypothetical protein
MLSSCRFVKEEFRQRSHPAMVWIEKDFSNFFTDGAPSRFPGDRTGDPFLGQVTF